jgi:hypothetical protein
MRAVLIVGLLLFAQIAMAENNERFAGNNIDVRTMLAFRAPQAAVQKMLPTGWELSPPAAGPSKGFNLGVILIDQVIAQDPDGNVQNPIRGAVLFAPAKKTGAETGGLMVLSGLLAPSSAIPGAYGVYTLADAQIERGIRTGVDGKPTIEESWQVSAGDNRLEFRVQYVRAMPVRGTFETKVFSSAKPDFYRIYRIDQASEVVRSTETGTDRAKTLDFKVSGPKFGALFDGSEQLVSVIAIPWYARQVYLPGS